MPTGPYASLAAEQADYQRNALPKPPTATKPKKVIVRPTATVGSTVIETPAQIEARVTRMADAAYNRQKSDLEAEAAKLRLEAEGRRQAMQAAYQAAAQANAGMGADVQVGWNTAANTLQGLAGSTTGGIQQSLQNDLATQEQALSRVGAGGTGFDARSQAGVEAYRGGFLPAEYFTRMGGVGREALNAAAASLNTRGLQEGIAAEGSDVQKINSDLLKQVSDLTSGRADYELKLREQLQSGQADQIKAAQAQQKADSDYAYKKIQIDQAQQKINLQYAQAKARATTTAQRLQLDQWYKQQNLILSKARNDIATARLGISQAAATTAKPPTASAISNTVARANKAGQNAFYAAAAKIKNSIPGMNPPADWDKKTDGDYNLAPAHIQAYNTFKDVASRQYFGTFMAITMNAIGPHLKAIGYTPAQIKRAAYQIVSADIDPPAGYSLGVADVLTK